MKPIIALLLTLSLASTAFAAGESITYKVDGEPYEGYYVSPKPDAPMVLLIHDWDFLKKPSSKKRATRSDP